MQELKDTRQLRLEAGLAQRDLANIAGVNVSHLSRIERGFRTPTLDEADSLARALRVSPERLLAAHRELRETATPGEGYTTVKSEGVEVHARMRETDPSAYRVLDLFCGCGGLSYGLEQTGRFAVTAGIDLLPDRIETFRANHLHATGIKADIREFGPQDLRQLAMDPDVVVGGPPCQGFSSIRPFRTLTEGDPRNSLVEEFVLVIAELRPRWFVFENVVGLLTHGKRAAFRALLQDFADIGYRTDWRVVNMALLGLPQVRERLVIVGSRDRSDFDWPNPTHFHEGRSMAGRDAKRLHAGPLFVGMLPPPVTVIDAIGDLPPIESGEAATEYLSNDRQNDYTRAMREGAVGLTLHEATQHSEKMMEIIRLAGTNRSALPEGLTSSGFSSCYSRLEADKPSVTVTVNFVHPASNRCIHPTQDRALTPREGARLQNFPDRFEFRGTRAQIVKQIGNAVPPLLGQAIGGRLAERMDAEAPRNFFVSSVRRESAPSSSRSVATGTSPSS